MMSAEQHNVTTSLGYASVSPMWQEKNVTPVRRTTMDSVHAGYVSFISVINFKLFE